jgi:hypothetical protein
MMDTSPGSESPKGALRHAIGRTLSRIFSPNRCSPVTGSNSVKRFLNFSTLPTMSPRREPWRGVASMGCGTRFEYRYRRCLLTSTLAVLDASLTMLCALLWSRARRRSISDAGTGSTGSMCCTVWSHRGKGSHLSSPGPFPLGRTLCSSSRGLCGLERPGEGTGARQGALEVLAWAEF